MKILAVFALLVPPLTGILTSVLATTSWYLKDGGASEGTTPLLQQGLMMAAYAVPLSYVMGGVQALFVGTGSALWAFRQRNLPLAVPLTLAFLAWLGFSAAISNLWLDTGQPFAEVAFSANGAFLLAVHLFAGALGWRLAKP
ncbi:MAG: hypothetical protein ABL907_02875 [Hyphomicrobium sp.]